MKVLTSKANSVIYYSYILLVFLTSFIFYSKTYELFEWNKMMFVYLMTIIIATFWLLRMVGEKRFIFEKTPLDIPLALFFLANLLSTVFSIDQHVSIFGYYSRLNGGLLSTISYLLLFYAFMANFPREKIKHLLGAIVFGGFLVSLWAIPEHFGIDPSCKLIVDSWKADCWVQDVQARVFATLGQPNWLAAYLAMIIPLSLGLMLHEKAVGLKLFYLISTVSMTMAFIFTYSRGGMLGLVAGLIVFGLLLLIKKRKFSLPFSSKEGPLLGSNLPYITILLLGVISLGLIFGTAFSKPINFFPSQPPTPTQSSAPTKPTTGTQLEAGGSETGRIRLIVWKGALEIWRSYPLFGSGVETFAYSYYAHRPVEHNHTTEWDFLYNKAHNEYLNYLATTGSFGFISYLFLIATFVLYTFYKLWLAHPNRLLIAGLLAGVVTYLVQNVFSFSVVIIALFFFLYPAIIFKLFNQNEAKASSLLNNPFSTLYTLIKKLLPKNKFSILNSQFSIIPILLVSSLLLFGLYRLYSADIKFNDGFQNEGEGGWETSKYLIEQAVILNPLEPFYMSELGYVNVVLASTATTDEEGLKRAGDAEYWATKATEISPNSLSYWKTLIKVYSELIGLYEGFDDKAIASAQKAKELAPTEPKVIFTLGSLYEQLGKTKEAINEFKLVTELKSDYREAYLKLARNYEDDKQRDEAIKVYKEMRTKFPQETEAPLKLKEWTGKED